MIITKHQIKSIEKETKKIMAKVFINRTYAVVSDIEIHRDIDVTYLTMRIGVFKDDNKTVDEQVIINKTLMLDIFSIKQFAALCANEALTKMGEISEGE